MDWFSNIGLIFGIWAGFQPKKLVQMNEQKIVLEEGRNIKLNNPVRKLEGGGYTKLNNPIGTLKKGRTVELNK